MVAHLAQSLAWTLLWATTIWSGANFITGLIYFLRGSGDQNKLLDSLTNHRNLSSFCWAVLIVFWWH